MAIKRWGENSDPSFIKHTISQREQGTERITAQRGCR